MTELPRDIRERTPAPHALRVSVRRPDLPNPAEVAKFCCDTEWTTEGGAAWFRLRWGADALLVLFEEGQGTGPDGFDHALLVESGRSKACFLAAYFIARRCGGVIRIRHRARIFAAGAFAEHYLEGEDLDARWSRVTGQTRDSS